jgi:hypothetical protein
VVRVVEEEPQLEAGIRDGEFDVLAPGKGLGAVQVLELVDVHDAPHLVELAARATPLVDRVPHHLGRRSWFLGDADRQRPALEGGLEAVQ